MVQKIGTNHQKLYEAWGRKSFISNLDYFEQNFESRADFKIFSKYSMNQVGIL